MKKINVCNGIQIKSDKLSGIELEMVSQIKNQVGNGDQCCNYDPGDGNHVR